MWRSMPFSPQMNSQDVVMNKRTRPPGRDRLVRALALVRAYDEDEAEWLAAHIGNLIDDRDYMRREITLLKRRLTAMERNTTFTKSR